MRASASDILRENIAWLEGLLATYRSRRRETMPQPLRDALYRAVRTFVQAWIGSFLLLIAGAPLAPGSIPDLDWVRRVALASAWAALIALLSWTQNMLENGTRFPALLKPAPPAQNPLPATTPREGAA